MLKNLTVSKNEALISNLETQLEALERRENKYVSNKEAVDNLNNLINKRKAYVSKLSTLENKDRNLDNEAKFLYKKTDMKRSKDGISNILWGRNQ